MKPKIIIPIILVLSLLTGCGKSVTVVDEGSDAVTINPGDYSGEMCYEVIDSYVTTDLAESGIDLQNIDQYASVRDSDGEFIDYPDFMGDDAQLTDGCEMYVVKLRVTNTDAQYKYEKETDYGSPYIFRADNISLCYISQDEKTAIPTTISYYSLRNEDESIWSTYELQPGETIEYEIGFILGPVVVDDSGKTFEVSGERLFLSGEDGYHRISWDVR